MTDTVETILGTKHPLSGLWSITPLATRLVQASVLNEPLCTMQLPDIYTDIWVISSLSWMVCPVLGMQILWDGGSTIDRCTVLKGPAIRG